MSQIENKVRWCLNKAIKEGVKHRGLRIAAPDIQKAEGHIRKALSNLATMRDMIRLMHTDWAVSAAFYTQYHCLLAILWKFGYESRNQECTIATIEQLIETGKIGLELSDVERIQSIEPKEDDVLSLRERFQYGTETSYEMNKINELFEESKNFIEKCKIILETE